MRVLAALTILCGLIAAQPARTTAWEYATVVANPNSEYQGDRLRTWSGTATICYANTEGCRYEQIVITSEKHIPPLGEMALMKATAMLGDQGWELVGVTELRAENPNLPPQLRHVFRRPKAN